MNSKKFILLSCVVQCVFAVPAATAQMRGNHAFMARPQMRRAPVLAPMARMPMHRTPMLTSTRRMQTRSNSTLASPGRMQTRSNSTLASPGRLSTQRTSTMNSTTNSTSGIRHFNDGDFDRDDGFRRINEIIIFDDFAFPFFPFFSFVPFPFYYPYPYYYPYGYGADQGDYGVNGSLVVQVQRRLASAGYYSGPIDGVIGRGTRRAIRAFERSHGLPVDGAIHRRLLTTMGLA